MVTAEEVREALKSVLDPELGINIVDLGLVYDINIENGNVRVTYTLTTPFCPIGPMVEEQIREIVMLLPGIESVEAEMTFSPPWDPYTMMSEEAKMELGF